MRVKFGLVTKNPLKCFHIGLQVRNNRKETVGKQNKTTTCTSSVEIIMPLLSNLVKLCALRVNRIFAPLLFNPFEISSHKILSMR